MNDDYDSIPPMASAYVELYGKTIRDRADQFAQIVQTIRAHRYPAFAAHIALAHFERQIAARLPYVELMKVYER
jgi:hypothetical protein